MSNEPRVVVVSIGQPPESLIAQLKKRGLSVEESGFADAEECIDSVEPDLVILDGIRGVMELCTLLDDPQRDHRPRLAIVAEGRELARLQGLNREFVVALLSREMSEPLVAGRLETLAKKWARIRSDPTIAGLTGLGPRPSIFAGPSEGRPLGFSGFPTPSESEREPFSLDAPAPPVPVGLDAPPESAPRSGRLTSPLTSKPSLPAAAQRSAPDPTEDAEAPPSLRLKPAAIPRPRHTEQEAKPAEQPPVEEPKPAAPEPPLSQLEEIDDLLLESIPPSPLEEIEEASPPPPFARVAAEAEGSRVSLDVEQLLAVFDPKAPAAESPKAESPAPEPPTLEPSAPLLEEPGETLLESVEPEPDEANDEEQRERPSRESLSSILDESTVVFTPSPVLLGAAESVKTPRELPAIRLEALRDEVEAEEARRRAEEPTLPRLDRRAPPLGTSSRKSRAPLVLGLTLFGAASAGLLWLATRADAPHTGATAQRERAPEASTSKDVPASTRAAGDSAAADGVPAAPPSGDAEGAPTAQANAPAGAQKAPAADTNPYRVDEAQVPTCEALTPNVEATTKDPVHEASQIWKGAREAIVRGDLNAAHDKMCRAVALHPESAALEGLGLLYVTREAPREALRWIERAEAARPKQRETQTLRGDALSQLGENEQALEAWLASLGLQATETARRRAAAKEDLTAGKAQLKYGDLPRAERLLRRSVALDPESPLGFVALAEVSLKRGRSASAVLFAERAIELLETYPEAHLILGDAARASGDQARARASYERALGIRPDFWPATLKLRELDAQ